MPLAKYVALHYNELAFPFRRFQIGKVYRGERAQRGRFREFYQADIDVIGDGELDIMNDAEIPAIIYDVFSAMGLKRFQIRINNRRVLNGFYSMLGLTEQSGEIMRTVDKIEKIGPDMVRAILVDDIKLTGEQADEILKFIAITGTNEEVLASLKGYCGRDELFDRGYEELSTVIKYLGGFGVAQENFKVDLTIARGLDYYTGTVYETALLDYPQIGSVCSGGRYDNLAEYYTDRKLPGVGISIGVTRLFYVLGEQGLLNDALNTAPADVLLLPMTEDLSFAVSLATRLRERGLRAQLYTENKKFKAKMNYADKTKVPTFSSSARTRSPPASSPARTWSPVSRPRARRTRSSPAFTPPSARRTPRRSSWKSNALRGIPCCLGKVRNRSDFLSFLGVRHSLTPFYSQIFHVFHISFLHCLCYIIGVDFSASAHGAPGISRYRRSVYGKANGTKRRELYAQARPLHRR